MTLEAVLELVAQTEFPFIKAGEDHGFTRIWIVEAEGRLFCRQYSFSSRSWYSAFQEDPHGYIRCGDEVIEIEGHIPADLSEITPKVNAAYLHKYGDVFPDNASIAHAMTGQKYVDKTMELIPVVSGARAN
ncbi:DUF2255 family protein [Pontibacter sp. G13]|uniref:DUF2255 family protein n=1 Tax=Pontibacter sp. G13 TaxID=3074898 RepID=UPI0028893975|nr:DUF2255 family protein [Pontibacter sp. G13]WNJ20500.1 DUF2255 family protein [Pontibacter sp. G13]